MSSELYEVKQQNGSAAILCENFLIGCVAKVYSCETFYKDYIACTFPVDTGRKLNVHKTFRRRPGCLLNVLCAFKLHPVSARLALLCNNFTLEFKTI